MKFVGAVLREEVKSLTLGRAPAGVLTVKQTGSGAPLRKR